MRLQWCDFLCKQQLGLLSSGLTNESSTGRITQLLWMIRVNKLHEDQMNHVDARLYYKLIVILYSSRASRAYTLDQTKHIFWIRWHPLDNYCPAHEDHSLMWECTQCFPFDGQMKINVLHDSVHSVFPLMVKCRSMSYKTVFNVFPLMVRWWSIS